MSRNPGFPQKSLQKLLSDRHQSQYVKKSYTISVITPMFGGGYEAGQVDTERIVRESAIKGHLRFWWRATRGAVFQDVQSLRQRETEIFGDTTSPSKVKLNVKKVQADKEKHYTFTSDGQDKQIPSYLFQKPKENKNSFEKKTPLSLPYIPKVTFELELRWNIGEDKELCLEIQAALWAWINFGGLGARTRRGCGALYCPEFSPNKQKIVNCGAEKWFKENVKKYELKLLNSDQSRSWPTLNPTIQVRTEEFRVWNNWSDLIDIYRKFRRKVSVRKFSKHPGRSFWPEADSIRSITGKFQSNHEDPFPTSKPKGMIAFPRAVLGMPIIFHFKKDTNTRDKDPFDTLLVPRGKQRLASPIILKPLAYGINNSFALIAVLNQPRIEGVELWSKGGNKKLKEISNVYTNLDYKGSPLKDANGNVHSSAVEAFLHSEEVKTFCEIKLTGHPS